MASQHSNEDVEAACQALQGMGFECMDTISTERLAEHWSASPPHSIVLHDYPDAQRRHIQTYLARALSESQFAIFLELSGW